MTQLNPDRQDPQIAKTAAAPFRPSSVGKESRVTVHDAVILGRFNWSLTATRLLMALVGQLRPEKDHFEPQFLRVQNLARLTDREYGSWYKDVRQTVRSLAEEVVEVQKRGWERISLLKDIRYLDDAGMIAAQFARGMRPYLLQQRELSTSWSLGNVLMLSTGYAMRHYMLGKLIHRDSRQRAFTIRDYRRFLKLEGKYPRFRDLKRRVIAPSIEEVNEQTGLSMSVDVERVARQPTVITFHVDRTSQTRMGRVYVLRARETNYWKIGYTTVSVEERLRAIQTGCPFTLEAFWEIETNEARSLETAFHQHLEKHRAQGEWFFLSEGDMRRAILDVENRWRKRPDTNA